jgi:hypothetical protein
MLRWFHLYDSDRKFFDEINQHFAPEAVRYDVVDSCDMLLELVK